MKHFGSVRENPSVNSWRDTLDRQTETFMDGLTEEDSVGEFAEVEQPFRQYPPSQTDLPAFFSLPANTFTIERVLAYEDFVFPQYFLFVCVCLSVNHSCVPVTTMGLARGHAYMKPGGLCG